MSNTLNMVGMSLPSVVVHILGNNLSLMKSIKQSEVGLAGFAQKATRLGAKLTLGLTVPLAAIGYTSVKAFASFDSAMTKSTAIMSSLTTKQRKSMEDLALTLSKTGVQSATELANAYYYLVSAGLTYAQTIESLPVVQEFATAGMFSLVDATYMLTDAQSALGLSSDNAKEHMRNMLKVSNLLNKANRVAHGSVKQFAQALTTQAANAMRTYRVSVEQGMAVLAAFANQGLKAQRAGTLFARMLRLTTQAYQRQRAAWKQAGLELFEPDTGKWRDFADIFRELTAHFDKISDKDMTQGLVDLGFQMRSAQTIFPLLDTGEQLAKFIDDFNNIDNTSMEVAEKQLTAFSAQLKILKGNIASVGISIGRPLAENMKQLSSVIIKATDYWNTLSDATQNVIVKIGMLVAVLPVVTALLGFLFKPIMALVTFLAKFVAGLLGAALAANPLTLIIVALTAAVVGLVVIFKDTEPVKRFFESIKRGAKEGADAIDSMKRAASTPWKQPAGFLHKGLRPELRQVQKSDARGFVGNILDEMTINKPQVQAPSAPFKFTPRITEEGGIFATKEKREERALAIKLAKEKRYAEEMVKQWERLHSAEIKTSEYLIKIQKDLGKVTEEGIKANDLLIHEQAVTFGMLLEGTHGDLISMWEKNEAQKFVDQVNTDIANNYLSMYDQINKSANKSMEYRLQLLEIQKAEHLRLTEDKLLVEQWYREQVRQLEIDAAIEGDNFFKGFAAKIEEMKMNYTSLGEIGANVAQGIVDGLTDSIWELTKSTDNWNESLKNVARSLADMAGKAALQGLLNFGMNAAMGGLGAMFGGAGGTVASIGTNAAAQQTNTMTGGYGVPTRHGGGMINANERLIKAKVGEGIFTQDQMKNLSPRNSDDSKMLQEILNKPSNFAILDNRESLEEWMTSTSGSKKVIEVSRKHRREING